MKHSLRALVCLFLIFFLTGCIGEDYDFTPPTVTLMETDSVDSVELTETNIDWRGENGKPLEKETKEVVDFARKQKELTFPSGQQVDVLFDSEDFAVEELRAFLWLGNEKLQLDMEEDRSFTFPKGRGSYVLEIDLQTDRGSAQYVGNIVIQ
ncbi:hypothetical protein N5C46_11210 [Rossellomorea vietnamensis]|uniref:Uncharacterized protein n=1 Tax=Rossellomorea vietnamensis TaxID=218284 RepID=A0ACD4CDP0_9BACI|nr:hypothetical protein [Rossellomorea vietnamensis]UXH46577.1 hypothetical protein N5C46_11210 [Rossellomorea vietnamensis]